MSTASSPYTDLLDALGVTPGDGQSVYFHDQPHSEGGFVNWCRLTAILSSPGQPPFALAGETGEGERAIIPWHEVAYICAIRDEKVARHG